MKALIFSVILNFLFLQISISADDAATENEYFGSIEITSTLVGIDKFSFVGKVPEGKTNPRTCRACVFEPPDPSKICCNGDYLYSQENPCTGGKKEELKSGTEYQLNMCYGTTDKKILTHRFWTKEIAKTKQYIFDERKGILTYIMEYRKPTDIPDKCKLTFKDDSPVQCLEGSTCTCLSGLILLPPNMKEERMYLEDEFGVSLARFTIHGPRFNDPSFYNFEIVRYDSNALEYKMKNTDPDISDESMCTFTNIYDKSKLKCNLDGTITEKCPCTKGALVEIKPATLYNIKIQSGDNVLYHEYEIEMTKPDRIMDHNIGIYQYKYEIKHKQGYEVSADECVVCIIKNNVDKKCCDDEIMYNSGQICRSGKFSKEDIENVGGRNFKINVCAHGNQIISDSFSMPKYPEIIEFIVTPSGIQYVLNFENNIEPDYCKFSIKTTTESETIEPRCLSANQCPCSSGLLSYPLELKAEATLIITDNFNDEIISKTLDLSKVADIMIMPSFCAGYKRPVITSNPPKNEASINSVFH